MRFRYASIGRPRRDAPGVGAGAAARSARRAEFGRSETSDGAEEDALSVGEGALASVVGDNPAIAPPSVSEGAPASVVVEGADMPVSGAAAALSAEDASPLGELGSAVSDGAGVSDVDGAEALIALELGAEAASPPAELGSVESPVGAGADALVSEPKIPDAVKGSTVESPPAELGSSYSGKNQI